MCSPKWHTSDYHAPMFRRHPEQRLNTDAHYIDDQRRSAQMIADEEPDEGPLGRSFNILKLKEPTPGFDGNAASAYESKIENNKLKRNFTNTAW